MQGSKKVSEKGIRLSTLVPDRPKHPDFM